VDAQLRCEIFPSDLDATVEFYVHILGFRLIRDERTAGQAYVALERGGVQLGAAARTQVEQPALRQPPTGVELVLEVGDVEADRARVARSGWPVVEDLTSRPWGLRDFRVLDPDGYYWRITSA
jgi:catechol 2,3-dioxygenase-like lactoylglutathione lyase family enzyme